MTFIRAVVPLIGFYVDFSNFLVGISFSLRLVLWSLFHPKRASSVDGSRSEEGPRFLFSVSLWRHHVHCIHGDLAPFGALHVVVSVRVSQSWSAHRTNTGSGKGNSASICARRRG